jgi:hypothetical protein
VLRVTAHVLERQNGNRGLVGKRRRWHAFKARRGSTGAIFVRDRTHEPVAAARQCLDPAVATRLLAKYPPERSNLDCQIALFDGQAGPCCIDQLVFGKRQAECHGSFANGEKQRDESPTGADLRTARLDTAALKLVISCGRPGVAGMPAFDEGAYKVRACYGRPLGAPPDNLYPSGATLSPDQIDAVIAYLQASIIGRGPITKAECLTYYPDRPDECDDIK